MPVTMEGPLKDLSSWKPRYCSIDKALRIVGTRSAMLVLREAYYGTTRFDDFVARVEITDASVAAVLRKLTAAGVLEKVPYKEPGKRRRYEYALTEMGLDLLPATIALMQWSDKWLQPDGGPLNVSDADGRPVVAQLHNGHSTIGLDDLHISLNSTWAAHQTLNL